MFFSRTFATIKEVPNVEQKVGPSLEYLCAHVVFNLRPRLVAHVNFLKGNLFTFELLNID